LISIDGRVLVDDAANDGRALLRQGDDQDPIWRHLIIDDKPHDLGRQGEALAGARSGQNLAKSESLVKSSSSSTAKTNTKINSQEKDAPSIQKEKSKSTNISVDYFAQVGAWRGSGGASAGPGRELEGFGGRSLVTSHSRKVNGARQNITNPSDHQKEKIIHTLYRRREGQRPS